MNGEMTLNVPGALGPRPERFSVRSRRLAAALACLAALAALPLLGFFLGEAGLSTDLAMRKQPPSLVHPFGTDWLGRDMLTRTVLGLRAGLEVGLAAAMFSSAVSLVLGLASGLGGRRLDALISGLVDAALSMPHLVLLILVAFALGGGQAGVVTAVAVSHWPRLCRVIRAEVMQLRNADYVRLARRLGRGPWHVARRHLLPHLVPQFLVGTLLLFPHAILHAAELTFLGFGVSPHAPSIGALLAEAMRHLSTGCWWLAVIPGLALTGVVLLFDGLASNLRACLDPRTKQE